MKDYVAFDLETTGLSLERDQIIEIGAVKIRDGKISGKYNCIIHPEIEVSDFIINLTGIDRDMLKKGISLKEGVEGFLEFSRNFPVLGHNVMFDYKFMKKAAASFKHNFEREGVDTLKVARKLLGELENKKLETLCAHYHYVNQAAHRAYDDALATAVVFEERISRRERYIYAKTASIQGQERTTCHSKTKEIFSAVDSISCDKGED